MNCKSNALPNSSERNAHDCPARQHEDRDRGHDQKVTALLDLLKCATSELLHRADSEGPTSARYDAEDLAARLYSHRRKLDEVFEFEGLAASPAWDILLDIWQAQHRNKEVSVSSACIGSGSASTTALRWLRVLEDRNLVSRHADPQDKRRWFVSLTTDGAMKIKRVLASF